MGVRSSILGSDGADSRNRSRMRAQSETVGMVLILGITIAGTGIMVSVGGDMLDNSKQTMEVSNAEHAMTQLDSKASLVGHSNSNAQEMTLGVGGRDSSVYAKDGGGWMRIRIEKEEDGTNEEILNQSLGAVVYENGGTRIAYQGGGVWKRTGGHSSMVSPPEFHYHEQTLTLPLVAIDNDATVGDSLRISERGSVDKIYPNRTAGRRNPLPEGVVNITVKSEYYDAWGRYFEDRTAGTVHYQPENERVTIQLTIDSSRPKVSQAIVSTSSQAMTIKGSGGSSFTDSYDSSEGDYASSKSFNGTIITSSGVDISGGAKVKGNLVSGGTVSMKGGANVTGNVSYVSFGSGNGNGNGGNYHIGGWKAPNGSAPEVGAVDGLIDAKLEEFKQNNSNQEAGSKIQSNRLHFGDDDEVKLKNGTYYLDEISMSSGQTLILDLSNGPIEIGVAGDISVGGGTIKVSNPDQRAAKVYMGGDSLSVTSGSNVTVPGDKSPAFWLYGPAGTEGEISGDDTEFTGVIYSPDSDTTFGSMSVTSHGKVYGAVIGGQMTLQSGGSVHFDQALRDRDPIQSGQVDISRVTYLHVTVNHVNVTSD